MDRSHLSTTTSSPLDQLKLHDTRILPKSSQGASLRYQHPELHNVLTVIEDDLQAIDRWSEKLHSLTRKEEGETTLTSSERLKSLQQQLRTLRSLESDVTRFCEGKKDTTVEMLSKALKEAGDVKAEHSITIPYGHYLHQIFLHSYQPAYQQITGELRALTTTPVIAPISQSVRHYYAQMPLAPLQGENPLREVFSTASITVSGKPTKELVRLAPTPFIFDAKNRDWQLISTIPPNDQHQQPGPTLQEQRCIALSSQFPFGATLPRTPHNTIRFQKHHGAPIGSISVEVKGAPTSKGLLEKLVSTFRGERLAEVTLTIVPPTALHHEARHARIDPSCCAISIGLHIPSDKARGIEQKINELSDTQWESAIVDLLDNPPQGKGGELICWLRDGLISPLGHHLLATTSNWQELSKEEKKFIMQHFIVADTKKLSGATFNERWTVLEPLSQGILPS